mgnify:FL=1
MKNKILKRTFALILILCLLFGFTPVYSYTQSIPVPNYYKNTDLGIIAYKQVSAFQVQLADGSILLDAGISTGSDVNIIENMSDVEIVFVLDTSGSMSDGKDQTTKESTKTLVNSLFDRIGAEHLKIGVLFFNSGLDTANILEMTNDQNAIMSHLDKIYANGGTEMADSLQKAHSMLGALNSDDDTIKIICTLSDGAIADEAETSSQIQKINSEGISTISIFVGTPITPAFASLAANSELHKNMETSTANLAETIVEDIYNEIYFKIILMSEPVTTYNVNHEGVLIGGDKIIFQVDEEILHGATLRIEYVISITTAFDMNNIVINDLYSSDFVFNQDEPLLSEASRTNRDYGWQMNGNTLVTGSGGQTIQAATEYRTKIVLSTVLTPERLPDLSLIGNSMTFSLNDIDHNNTISVGQDANIKALDFLIIPPTGTEDLTTEDLLFLLKLTIFALAAVIFIAFIHNHLRERRRYYK